MTPVPAEARTLAVVQAELARLVRYDDESVVHQAWIRQRYDRGAAASYAPARTAAVRTAWHEAGHAVAALAVGARFSSASIRHGSASQGRVHSIQGGGDRAFVIDAAGQLAERLRDWSMLAATTSCGHGCRPGAPTAATHAGSGTGSPLASAVTRWRRGGTASRR